MMYTLKKNNSFPHGAVVNYDEIALKGRNRHVFEEKLVANINFAFKKGGLDLRARNSRGRIFIDGKIDELSAQKAQEILSFIPGISGFGLYFKFESLKDLYDNAPEIFADKISGSFRVTAKRADKSFEKKSNELEREFAEKLFDINPNLNAKMKDFDQELMIEVLNEGIFVYFKKKGIGGLPTGVSGKAVLLMSAGFDSPVAGFMMQKRGIEIYPLHFHSMPKTGPEPTEAVKELAGKLASFQNNMTLSLVPVLELQRYIAMNGPEKLRIVLLRRAFMRMASRYAKKQACLAIITGESVGQVASQTLENIFATNEEAEYPVLRPLCGMNKNEIIGMASKIGTAKISSRPCEDTCSLFLPERPETKAKMQEVLEVEKSLTDLQKYEDEVFGGLEIIKY